MKLEVLIKDLSIPPLQWLRQAFTQAARRPHSTPKLISNQCLATDTATLNHRWALNAAWPFTAPARNTILPTTTQTLYKSQ